MARTTFNHAKYYIGIDNGVSGSIGIIGPSIIDYMKTPVFKQQDYTKAKQSVTRIDGKKLFDILERIPVGALVFVMLERPMVNPQRFKATKSALRALEATVILLETLDMPYAFCDSKEWQKMFLPSSGAKKADPAILKQESKDIGIRLFPTCKEMIEKQKDADGILIAEWARRCNL